MITGLTAVVALVMAVGLVGIVVPVLPGLLLVWASTILWAARSDSPGHGPWVVVAIATIMYAVGLVLQYRIPGRRLRAAGVSTLTLVLAVCCAIVGAFVIPVVGAIPGFVLGILLVELARSRDGAAAWAATKHALRAVGLSMLIELMTALTIVATWVVGVALTQP